MLAAARAEPGVPAACPIVLVGHNFVQYDLVSLLCQARRVGFDLYAGMRDAGVMGVVDTLHVARALAWPTPPTDPDTEKPSYKLGACYAACGHGLLDNAHDAEADVVGNQAVLTSALMLRHLRSEPVVYSLDQAVLRARQLRQRHANMPSAARERAELLLVVQRFADDAPAAARLALAPAPAPLRGAAHSEAARLGISSTGGGSGDSRHVVLVQAPP